MSVRVLRPGLLSTLQDLGRYGLQHIGVVPCGAMDAVALELDLRFHLDGARLLNAAVATGIDAAEIAGRFDTVMLCLSKGLGCPLGAILAGQSEVMGNARRFKHLFGGAMRQAGIVAAAGLYALDHHVQRLAGPLKRRLVVEVRRVDDERVPLPPAA